MEIYSRSLPESKFVPKIIRGFLSGIHRKDKECRLVYNIYLNGWIDHKEVEYERFKLEIDDIVSQAREYCESNGLTLWSY